MSTARERMTEALKGKTRGFRGPGGERQMVEVRAEDLREVANAHAADDPYAANLARGSAAYRNEPPNRMIVVQADDLFHLLGLAEE